MCDRLGDNRRLPGLITHRSMRCTVFILTYLKLKLCEVYRLVCIIITNTYNERRRGNDCFRPKTIVPLRSHKEEKYALDPVAAG